MTEMFPPLPRLWSPLALLEKTCAEAGLVEMAMVAAAKAARTKVWMLNFMAVLLLGSGLDDRLH
jgi:hypothetical protein